MRYLGFFVLAAACALPPSQALAQSRGERQAARQQAAISRMVAPSRPAPAQARGPSAMPSMQRPMRMPQQRAYNPQGIARSGAMRDADMNRALRSRVYNQPRYDRAPGASPRVMNTTAALDRPVQEPIVSRERADRRDANRADRLRDFVDRNRAGRNRGGNFVAAPGANVENLTGGGSSTTTDQQEHRRWDGDRNRDRDRDGDGRNGRDRHRNWHERHEGDPNFDRKHRRWHNREWWRRNYTRFVLFGGGYYYWNRGFWYPAYGYDPYYSSYTYEAPLYAYNGLPPGQIISLVQSKLQQRGYYNAAVDGNFGPMTQQAIMDFQADHGLSMTGEIDQDTLNALDFD